MQVINSLINLEDFATTELTAKKFSKKDKKFTVEEGLLPESGNLYSGYKIKFTTGVSGVINTEYLISSTVNNILAVQDAGNTVSPPANQMSDTNFDQVSTAGDKFSLIAPDTF